VTLEDPRGQRVDRRVECMAVRVAAVDGALLFELLVVAAVGRS
jgi:hypothetical protein